MSLINQILAASIVPARRPSPASLPGIALTLIHYIISQIHQRRRRRIRGARNQVFISIYLLDCVPVMVFYDVLGDTQNVICMLIPVHSCLICRRMEELITLHYIFLDF